MTIDSNLGKVDEVMTALYDIHDPEIGMSIVDLDLIKHVEIGSEGVPTEIKMVLTTPFCPYEGVKGMHVALNLADVAACERIYAGLSAGARKIDMPLQPTFWAARFASFTDRYGTPWLLNCDLEA